MRIRYLTPLILFSYLISLALYAPATLLLDLLGPQQPLKLQGVSGSLIDGHASAVQLAPGQQIENLNWQLTPSSLLMARLGSQLDFRYLGGSGNGHVGVTPTGATHLSNVRYEVAAKQLEALLPLPLATFDGQITALIDNVLIEAKLPKKANGRLFWNKAVISTPLPASVRLGQVEVLLQTEAETILLQLSNKGGELSLGGTVKLLPSGQYDLDLSLKPVQRVAQPILNALNQMARRQPDGSYRMQDKGSLKDLL